MSLVPTAAPSTRSWRAALAWLTSSRVFAAGADRMTLVALPVFAVQVCGLSLSQTAVLYSAQTLPGLLALAVGKPLDASARLRAWCIGADLARCVILGLLVAGVATGLRPGWPALLVAAACLGCGEVVYSVSAQAYLPRVVAGEHLSKANTWLARTQGLADVAGLPAAGVLVTTAGPAAAVAMAAAGFAFAAVPQLRLPASGPAPAAKPDAPRADERWTAGLFFLLRDRALRAVIGAMLLLNLGGGMIGALWMTHVTRVLRVPADRLGLIMALGGASALAGSALVGRLLTAWGPRRCVRRALPIGVAALGCVPLAAVLPVLPTLAVFQLVFSACAVTIAVAATTLRQHASPARLQARVFAAVRTGQSIVLPISGLIAAAITWGFGSEAAMIAGAALAAFALPLLPAIGRRAVPAE
jgi:MFS family permease